MKRFVLPFLIFAYAHTNGQETGVKEFFKKYFVALDISKHCSDWVKDLNLNSSLVKYEFQNPELNDSIFINYKIKKHPLIAGDSIKAFLSYKLRVNIDSISKRILDPVFIIHLYFIYGREKIARHKMSAKFIAIRKETRYFDREYQTSGKSNDNYYYGYAYDLKGKLRFPYILSVTRTISPGSIF